MSLLHHPKIPRYFQLAEELRLDIEAGRLQPGEQLPPFLAMKTQHGLSQSTWERMLGLLEAEGLIVREAGRGTFVADGSLRRARGKTRTHYTLGVLGWGFSSNEIFWSQIFNGIQEAAHDAGCDVTLLHRSGRSEGWEKVDGVLLGGEARPQAVLKSKPLSLPLVRLLTGAATSEIAFDEARGVMMATRHLVKLGHRRIGSLMTNIADINQRETAYRAALREEKIRFQSSWLRRIENPQPFQENYFYRSAHDALRHWLQDDWQETGCTALLCQNDQMALGALAALRQAGVLVPDEVSVVGFDGTEISEYSHPRLTTIEVPLHEIGRRGAQLLIERIESSDNARAKRQAPIVLPVRLKIGESSAPPQS